MLRSSIAFLLFCCLSLLVGCGKTSDTRLILDFRAAGAAPTSIIELEVGETLNAEVVVNEAQYENIAIAWEYTSPTGAVTTSNRATTGINAGVTTGEFDVNVQVTGNLIASTFPVVKTASFRVRVVEPAGPLEPGDAIQSVQIGTKDCPKGEIIDFVGGQTYPVTITPKGAVFDATVSYNAQVGTVTPTGTFTADWTVPNTPGLKAFFVTMESATTAGGTKTETEFSFLVNITP